MAAHRFVIFTGLSPYPRLLTLAGVTGDAAPLEADSDVVALRLQLIADAGTEGGVSTIDIDLSAVATATFAAYITHLNTVVKTAHSLAGSFLITSGRLLVYDNIEKFTRASSLEWDLGTFNSTFTDTMN